MGLTPSRILLVLHLLLDRFEARSLILDPLDFFFFLANKTKYPLIHFITGQRKGK